MRHRGLWSLPLSPSHRSRVSWFLYRESATFCPRSHLQMPCGREFDHHIWFLSAVASTIHYSSRSVIFPVICVLWSYKNYAHFSEFERVSVGGAVLLGNPSRYNSRLSSHQYVDFKNDSPFPGISIAHLSYFFDPLYLQALPSAPRTTAITISKDKTAIDTQAYTLRS